MVKNSIEQINNEKTREHTKTKEKTRSNMWSNRANKPASAGALQNA